MVTPNRSRRKPPRRRADISLTLTDYIQSLKKDGIALADAAEGRLDKPVPSCPEWSVADLVWHTGEVHYFWRTIAGQRLQSYKDVQREERPEEPRLLDWFRSGLEHTVSVLAASDPSTEVWTWSPVKTVGWIQRRMAQETAVHRWDAEAAGGTPGPIDTAIALDGIDEFLEYFVRVGRDAPATEESIHLHSTDGPGEWFIKARGEDIEVTREHAKGDAAVRAPASDLLLMLWRRIQPSQLEVLGDPGVLGRFLARADLE